MCGQGEIKWWQAVRVALRLPLSVFDRSIVSSSCSLEADFVEYVPRKLWNEYLAYKAFPSQRMILSCLVVADWAARQARVALQS